MRWRHIAVLMSFFVIPTSLFDDHEVAGIIYELVLPLRNLLDT